MRKVKELVVSTSVPQYYDMSKEVTIEADASKNGLDIDRDYLLAWNGS